LKKGFDEEIALKEELQASVSSREQEISSRISKSTEAQMRDNIEQLNHEKERVSQDLKDMIAKFEACDTERNNLRLELSTANTEKMKQLEESEQQKSHLLEELEKLRLALNQKVCLSCCFIRCSDRSFFEKTD